MKINDKIEAFIRHSYFELYKTLFVDMSKNQRDSIDWYLLSIAMKANGEQRELLVSKFIQEQNIKP